MSVQFIHMAWLPLLVLVAGPLLVHLLARARPPAFLFPSVLFIRRIVRYTRRVKRPQDLLLLILRTLLIAAAVLLFLRPLFFGSVALSSHGMKRSVVLVVDASASMAYVEHAQSRFASACAEAADILAGLAPGDMANLIWLRSPPEAVFPEPGVNHRRLREALRRGEVSQEAGDIPGALRMAAEMLADAEGKREVFVVSDFQATAWRGVDLQMPEGVALATVQPDCAEGENLAVLGLHTEPVAPLAGESVRVFARIGNFSSKPRAGVVFFEVGEKRERQEVSLGPWSEGTAVVQVTPPHGGRLLLSATLGEDRFAPDNRCDSAINVLPFLRVGLLGDDDATLDVWKRILEALPWARVERTTFDATASWGRYDALLASGWGGEAIAGFHAALGRGATVVCSPAAGTRSAVLSGLSDRLSAADDAGGEWRRDVPGGWLGLEVARPDDRLFAAFGEGEFGDPGAGRFRERLRPASAWTGGETLLQYPDGVPALVRVESTGQLYLWNMPVDRRHSTWAAQPEAVVLLGELLLTSRHRAHTDGITTLAVGEQPSCRLGIDVLASELRLRSERRGETLQVARHVDASQVSYVAPRARRPGVYTWSLGEEIVASSVVRFPSRESDLRCLSPDELARSGIRPVASGRDVRALHEGLPLWPWLLGLSMVVILVEGAVAWWAMRS